MDRPSTLASIGKFRIDGSDCNAYIEIIGCFDLLFLMEFEYGNSNHPQP